MSDEEISDDKPKRGRPPKVDGPKLVRGVGGAAPADPAVTPGTTATDGTQAAFIEDNIKTVMKAAFSAGAKPRKLVMGAHAKITASGFTGRVGSTIDISKNVSSSNVTKYESDFGTLDFIPHPYLRSSGRTVLGLDPSDLKVAYLRKFRSFPLAKIGDAETREILSEYTLVVGNEKAHFVIADRSTS